jgi:hypothetical protein
MEMPTIKPVEVFPGWLQGATLQCEQQTYLQPVSSQQYEVGLQVGCQSLQLVDA